MGNYFLPRLRITRMTLIFTRVRREQSDLAHQRTGLAYAVTPDALLSFRWINKRYECVVFKILPREREVHTHKPGDGPVPHLEMPCRTNSPLEPNPLEHSILASCHNRKTAKSTRWCVTKRRRRVHANDNRLECSWPTRGIFKRTSVFGTVLEHRMPSYI